MGFRDQQISWPVPLIVSVHSCGIAQENEQKILFTRHNQVYFYVGNDIVIMACLVSFQS